MRDFALEVFFARWEFAARHHLTASDAESLSLSELLAMASPADRAAYDSLSLGYTETSGAPDLRERIAATYDDLSAQHILCLAGAGEGLYATARVLLEADDHVIVPLPNYQSAESVPASIARVTGVPMDYAGPGRGGWRLDVDAIRAAIEPQTKLLSLNFPHNPTGYVMPREDFASVVDLCRQHGLYLLCDEVYRGVEQDAADRLPQVADVYERGLSLNVLSKAYGLPGLRIGWLATRDAQALGKIARYKHYLSICNSAPSERLAMIALDNRDAILSRVRGLIAENLQQLDALFAEYPALFEWARPAGGCTAFPRYLGGDGVETFCRRLLEDSGVLLLPASIYASELGRVPPDHFRIGFGRGQSFRDGIRALRQHLERHYAAVAT